MTDRVTVFAPGSVGNIGPGLDILGLALGDAGDTVEATATRDGAVTVVDAGHPDLPREATANTAAMAARAALNLGGGASRGLALRIRKGLPLSGGQGGSAASAVAGAVAANALYGLALSERQLIDAALAAEVSVAGWHLDNILPSLLGGIILVSDAAAYQYQRIPPPADLRVVVASPAQRLRTAEARAVLPREVPRDLALQQAAAIGTMIIAFTTGRLDLLRQAIQDRIAEPVRAPLLPGFAAAKAAALEAGALGCSISGSGPAVFAMADSDALAERVGRAMVAGYASQGVTATCRTTGVSTRGAHVVAEG